MNAITVISKDGQELLNQKDLEILKKGKFKKFTDDEVSFASKVCTLVRLNPLLNQIHFVKRGDVVTPQVAIDGYRLTAQRAGGYAGSDEPVFEFAPGDQQKKRPVKATVTVYRIVEGQRCPFTASARWDEFHPGSAGDHMWTKMPHNQLAKCAEALALRKAFPAELSILRTDEEMAQADRPSKAKAVQDQITEPPAIEAEHRNLDEPQEPSEKIRCQCGNDLKLSKSGKFYFCPDYNIGEHIKPVSKAEYERSL